MRAIASCLPFLLLSLGGCARKLPGPAECRAFALESIGVEPRTPASVLDREPRLAAHADEITRQCLATPWDYQLLTCFSRSRNTRPCLAGFEARRLNR